MNIKIKNFFIKKKDKNRFYFLGLPLEIVTNEYAKGFFIKYLSDTLFYILSEKGKDYNDFSFLLFEYLLYFNYENLKEKIFIRLSILGILLIIEIER